MTDFTRRQFLQFLAATTATTATTGLMRGAPAPGPAPVRGGAHGPSRPNIIYMVIHDLGRHLSPYGAKINTPNLQRFADEGVTFTNAYCNAPACSPSRGCAMSGQYSHTNGLMGLENEGWILPLETRTIVDYLNDAGYETTHVGFQHERHRLRHNNYQVELSNNRREENYIEATNRTAIEYLETRDSDKPFYLNIGTIETHPTCWNNRKLGRNDVYGIVPPEEAYVPDFLPDFEASYRLMGKFQGCVEYLDRQVQDLFDAVARLGLRENTLVIVAVDHGIQGLRCKGTIYDKGTEMALMMQMPGTLEPGVRIDHLIQNIDLTPTLLEAAGAPIPSEIQGKSFWPLLTGGTYQAHPHIFTELNWHVDYQPERSIRTPDFQYIRFFRKHRKRHYRKDEIEALLLSDDREWLKNWWTRAVPVSHTEELYNLRYDPYALNNLADNPVFASAKADLRQKIDTWMRETDDPLLQGPIPDGNTH